MLLILCTHGSKGIIIHPLSCLSQKPGYHLHFSSSLSPHVKSLSVNAISYISLKSIYLFPPAVLNALFIPSSYIAWATRTVSGWDSLSCYSPKCSSLFKLYCYRAIASIIPFFPLPSLNLSHFSWGQVPSHHDLHVIRVLPTSLVGETDDNAQQAKRQVQGFTSCPKWCEGNKQGPEIERSSVVGCGLWGSFK